MATTVVLHDLHDLSSGKDEILLGTNLNTELHIIRKRDNTIIKLPFGNKFDVIDGIIYVREKHTT